MKKLKLWFILANKIEQIFIGIGIKRALIQGALIYISTLRS